MRIIVLSTFLVICGCAYAQNGIARAAAPAPAPAAQQSQVPATAPTPTPPAQALPAPALGATPSVSHRNPVLTPTPMPQPGMPMPLPAGTPSVAGPADLKREAIDRIAPLTPEEIKDLRQDLLRRGNAMTEPMEPPPKPVRRQVTLDLSPGASPEIIRAAFSQGSVVTFVDAAGRPWPVMHADNFAPNGFDVATFGANGVSVGVKREAARAGNMAVLLEGLSVPVSFGLVSGQREVDYSIEVRLPRYLPTAPPPVGMVDRNPALGAEELLNYLLNTPPQGAKALAVDAPGVQAWQVSAERMIVRAEGLVASPAWQRRQSSATGVSVYDLPITPVVLLAAQGQLTSVRVSGFAATKEQR